MIKNTVLIYVDDQIIDDTPLQNITDSQIVPLVLEETFLAQDNIENIYFSLPVSYKGVLSSRENILVRSGNTKEDWNSLIDISQADNCIRVYGDAPFTDINIVQEMLEIHTTYTAEYTYSENVPSGFACDIISKYLIQSLPDGNEGKEMLPVEKVIRDNINQFDVELYYKEPDIRHKRLTFRTADPRERRVCEHIFKLNSSIPSYSTIKTVLDQHPEVLYIAPSYLELQLTTKKTSKPLYAHPLHQEQGNSMTLETLDSILTGMKGFNMPYNTSLTFGDPLLHEDFYSIMAHLLDETNIETLIIETEAVFTDTNFISWLSEHNDPRIKIIVECNGYNSDTYSQIHSLDFFDQVLHNIRQIREIIGNRCYIQIMKIDETEPFLDAYYDFWEQQNISIILQKQNTWLGVVTDRRYYDLTPLTRMPCWHLQRDLYITAAGCVSYCKQDVNAKFSSYNVNEMPISEIWEKRKPLFLKDCSGSYPSAPDCSSCDEWFTFNL